MNPGNSLKPGLYLDQLGPTDAMARAHALQQQAKAKKRPEQDDDGFYVRLIDDCGGRPRGSICKAYPHPNGIKIPGDDKFDWMVLSSDWYERADAQIENLRCALQAFDGGSSPATAEALASAARPFVPPDYWVQTNVAAKPLQRDFGEDPLSLLQLVDRLGRDLRVREHPLTATECTVREDMYRRRRIHEERFAREMFGHPDELRLREDEEMRHLASRQNSVYITGRDVASRLGTLKVIAAQRNDARLNAYVDALKEGPVSSVFEFLCVALSDACLALQETQAELVKAKFKAPAPSTAPASTPARSPEPPPPPSAAPAPA